MQGSSVESTRSLSVAILLATHNGARFIDRQIRSLAENFVRFTLHWIDDHSTDNTRELVRSLVLENGIALCEWHDSRRHGVPGAFFHLLTCVHADIYLFCDQDDIWQAGKIDATAATLTPLVSVPVLCFSNAWMFRNDEPDRLYRLSEVVGVAVEDALQESRLFMAVLPHGHTQGFTRALRDIFVEHEAIARTHAIMHDLWMYDIAVAAGEARYLSEAPTTLYRTHGRNCGDAFNSWRGDGIGRISMTWSQHQTLRRALALHATGFTLAAPTLPAGPKLDRLLEVARLVSTLHRRQSPTELVRLVRRGVVWPNTRLAAGLSVACLCSDARN